MNLSQLKLGAEPKKIGALVVLLLIASYFLISNHTSSGPETSVQRLGTAPAVTPSPVAKAGGRRNGVRVTQKGLGNNNAREFRPSFRIKDVDPSAIDPTLRLALLAKLQDVKVEPTGRSLFEISAGGPGPIDMRTIKEPAHIAIARSVFGPPAPKPPAPPPPPPSAPAIPLKFYGFINPAKAGVKRAFFLDGDDIIIAGEGDMVKKRYKIVRIGVNSAVVEDMQFKSAQNFQQTLPLEAEMAG